MQEYNILDFGAVADGVSCNSTSIQRAIDACAAAGGGRVLVPAGVFMTGTIWLKSHVELHLCHGAVLLASPNLSDYNEEDAFEQNFHYASEEWCGKHLILAVECEDIAITGTGVIDGNGAAHYAPPIFYRHYIWRAGLALARDKENLRPGQLVFVVESNNVKVTDITVRNATSWCLFFYGCDYVQVRGAKIFNPPEAANTDGINIDTCRYVTVSDCIIDTGDDAIPIRCNKKYLKNRDKVCEHITVTNCVLGSSSSVFRIGIGNLCEIRHLNISNITVTRGAVGIHLMVSYHGTHVSHLSHLNFSNITATDVCYPINISGSEGCAEHIRIENYSAYGYACSKVVAEGDCLLRDIALSNVSLYTKNLYPELTEEVLFRRGDTPLRVQGVKDLRLDHVRSEIIDGSDATWNGNMQID
ncbi:MAG: hypothetical protein E7624_03720 [Ruminococcaceae bacterium]|nr:hypothetical protein [Oscillospiraceae bacterium]